MQLTKHQTEVLEQALVLLKSSTNRLVIKGSAGVGKTTVVDQLIQKLISERKNQTLFGTKVFCTTPTNKALGVLINKVTQSPKIYFRTIHSLLNVKAHINNKTGEVTFKPTKKKVDKNFEILVIDEASMLPEELLSLIEEYYPDKTVIFLGDEKQLNPVGEITSPIFSKNFTTLELTEIIRQGEGNPIIEISRNLKEIHKKEANFKRNGTGYIFTDNKDRVVKNLVEENKPEFLKYLAWTRREVNDINDKVRKQLYTNPAKIEKGETLVFNTPYQYQNADYSTSDTIVAAEVNTKLRTFSLKFAKGESTVELKIYEIKTEGDTILVLHEETMAEYDKTLKTCIDLCLKGKMYWKDFIKFREQFADLAYSYATTIHKSQGSTYHTVIINYQDVMKNRNVDERDRLLYTAITRASNLVVFHV